MTVFIHHVFERLKKDVLSQAGYAALPAASCKALAAQIQAKTRKNISDTTIKRLYGHAYARFNPSAFTLDVLAEFCGKHDWNSYCFSAKPSAGSPAPDLENLLLRSRRISGHTLQALKSRSGVPFSETIARGCVNEQLTAFAHGDTPAFVLAGPGGSGKTIALCHWLQDRMHPNGDSGDVYLFFSSHTLAGPAHDGSLKHWLLMLLGVEGSEALAAMLSAGRKLWLVIDGLDASVFREQEFNTLFNQLLDMIAVYGDRAQFRIICTMRSDSWLLCRKTMTAMNGMSERWDTGYMQNDVPAPGNIFPFSYDELFSLAKIQRPDLDHRKAFDERLMNLLSDPQFFQHYRSLFHPQFSLMPASALCIFQVVQRYIADKLFAGKLMTEKSIVIRDVLRAMTETGEDFAQLQDVPALHTHQKAYQALIELGLFRENLQFDAFSSTQTLAFAHPELAACFYAGYLYNKHDRRVSAHMLEQIARFGHRNADPVLLLKWILFHAIKKGEYAILEQFARVNLPDTQAAELFAFGCSCAFHERSAESDAAFAAWLDAHPGFLAGFLDPARLSPEVEHSLQLLAQLALGDESRLEIDMLLATAALWRLDTEMLKRRTAAMRRFPEQVTQHYPLHPALCFEALLSYLQHGLLRRPVLQALTHLVYQPASYATPVFSETYRQLLAVSMLLGGDPRKTAALSGRPETQKSGVKTAAGLIPALAEFFAGKTSHPLPAGNSDCPTPVHDLLILLAGRGPEMETINRRLQKKAGETGYVLFAVLGQAITLYQATECMAPQLLQDLKFRFHRTLRGKALRVESFMPVSADKNRLRLSA